MIAYLDTACRGRCCVALRRGRCGQTFSALARPDAARPGGPAAADDADANTSEREVRNYPEQPPLIPHSIEGYEISVNANKCLSCHARARSANRRRR